jgi:acetyltransferase
MPQRHLDKLFKPASLAVIGATGQAGAVGNVIMRNLLEGGFGGPIMPVNPRQQAVGGVLTYPTLADLPVVPDLAVVCTRPGTVPGIIEELGRLGTRAAIVVAAGMARTPWPGGGTARDALAEAVKAHRVRVLGPNCLGLLVPGIGLNASFAHTAALGGEIAFVSQSGALCTAVLDWARSRRIGFSHFVSLGDAVDVDFDDVIDYLGSDPGTRAILLYIEAIQNRRDFMSAARAAARNKPVLVIKSGRFPEGARAAHSHTGALAGSDEVYDAAIRRAGMLRVFTIEELFAAVETLARARRPKGDRLAIMTNGGGIGVMAVDKLVEDGGRVAKLSDDTLAKLDAVLPPAWSRGNPIDIIGDAPGERYAQAARLLLDAPEVDALLVMHAPTATASSLEAAKAVAELAAKTSKPVLTAWVGGEAVAPARRLFAHVGIPTYETPNAAVGAFMHLNHYRRNQELLMETPPSVPVEFQPATTSARLIVEGAVARGEAGDNGVMMSEPEAKAVLAAYGIPTIETHIVKTPEEAAAKAAEIGFPVALKILSDKISHKSDVGGVDLFLDSEDSVRKAADTMHARIAERLPGTPIQGFTVQKMALRPGAHELILGVACDPVFGPVILFGQGGTAVEVIGDRAVGLPPLNMNLARELIGRTRVARLLKGYRNRPPVDMETLCLALVRVSQLVVDVPEIVELDINPLLADEEGVLALDARIRVARPTPGGARRLAIRPYPQALEEWFRLRSGRKVLLRPIRPEDEPEHYEFIAKLTPEDIRFRFFGLVRELPHSQMARFTQIDYDREMAFIASAPGEAGGHETLGVVRTVTDVDNETAEFAIVVRSDLVNQGLGTRLLEKMIAYCRSRGTKRIVGQVMTENARMRDLARVLGFTERHVPGEAAVEVTLALNGATASPLALTAR